ncbi:MAG: type III secretion system chaperone [Kiritimatiellae bacterium]|nr:type III secretion system chaperone [Kiritimatiellia bacterium]
MNAAVARFVTAIGYPIEEIERTEGPVSLLVDELTIQVLEARGSLVLRFVVGRGDEADAAELAGYAAGRILKEEATLAYDPEAGEIILWQRLPANAREDLCRTAFELFMVSCEWWHAAAGRRTPETGGFAGSADNEMRIMP